MEKVNLKKFKKAGKKVLATALVLGLGSGIFAGCENKQTTKNEFNEKLYSIIMTNDLVGKETTFDGAYLASVEKNRKIYTEFFTDPNLMGGIIEKFDYIDYISSSFNSFNNEMKLYVHAIKDGKTYNYEFIGTVPYEVDKSDNMNFWEVSYVINLFKEGKLNKDFFELIFKTDSIDEKTVQLSNDWLNKNLNKYLEENNNHYLRKLLENGYDLYIRQNSFPGAVSISISKSFLGAEANSDITCDFGSAHYNVVTTEKDYDVFEYILASGATFVVAAVNEETGDIKEVSLSVSARKIVDKPITNIYNYYYSNYCVGEPTIRGFSILADIFNSSELLELRNKIYNQSIKGFSKDFNSDEVIVSEVYRDYTDHSIVYDIVMGNLDNVMVIECDDYVKTNEK